MDKEVQGIELRFIVDGEEFGSPIEVPEKGWQLSEYKTYEECYVSGHFTQPGRTGYSYSLWLERPLAKDRR